MERRRAAAALLALAACFACSAAAPTASSSTALDLHDGPREGCYYNFQHYGEGDRIMTNEPCLNCTCHNRMLMCYLRVCPFTKAIGQDCTVEKRADQCCPIVTCPDVPVDLLTSTSTTSPAEYGSTGVGKLDKYGCSINNKYFPEGSKVPSSPNKPCEHCYCIRNMTTCVMQECTLHVDGCTPIYHKDVCCPVRYSCDHSEDEIPLLDDMTTTVRPTQGFLLTTTTMMPVTQMTQDCIHDDQIFPDGTSIKTDKACEHCYCMKGDIVCVVQECGTPMENEGKHCTSLPPRQGQCCPDTYICEGDEPSLDLTTETVDLTSAPPRRLGVEGSGYRNEPDEPYTERGPIEDGIEGSGDISETDISVKVPSTIRDELLTITEKEVPYSQTTEADKEFSIITDKISEKEPAVTFEEDSFTRPTESILLTSTESKATVVDEIITTDRVTSKHEEDNITTKAPFQSYEGDEMLPTDISIEKETSLNIPEQSTLIDEHSGYSVTESTTSIKKETEITIGSTEIVTPDDVNTTERPVFTEKESSNDEVSEINKIDIVSEMTNADVSVTEQNRPGFDYTTVKEMNIMDDITTVSSKKDTTETTSINPVDNEVDYIPSRIPGEGDCLLNGITYNNNTSVPSTNNCHTGCKCISSIVKCDPIICSPPPEYMENMNDCQTSYDTPDSCCPTYICSAKETSLPQSHSQTSVTESSKPVSGGECNGNECISDEVKQLPSKPHKICDSGNCDSESTQNECGINGCQGEEQPPLERPTNCSGGKCSVSPTVLCDSENCETPSTEEKVVDDKIHSESQGKPICNDDGGCDNVKDTSPKEDECKDESCRRKDTFETETNVNAECSGTECKIDDEQKIPHIEPTIAPVTEDIINQENTEMNAGELDTQKTAQPVPNIITPDKVIETESTTDIGAEPVTVKVQLQDKTVTDVIPTEEPVKLITESAVSITDDTVTKIDNIDKIVTTITENPKEEVTKLETSPTDLMPMSDSATEKTKTSDETPTDKESYTQTPDLDKTETFTGSSLVDYTSENKDTPSEGFNKEVSQTTTEKSEIQLDIYKTKPDESFTKSPIVMDTEKEMNIIETPNFPENEIKVTAGSEDYPMATEKLDTTSITSMTSDETVGITVQPTKIQENVQTELPENVMGIGGNNEDHSEIIPTDLQDLTTEIIQNDKIEDNNKFTTVKSIILSEVTENPTPMKTETQSILLETISSESTTPEIISADKTYTELPQSLGTQSDIDESGIKFEGSTTPSSSVKQPEEVATKLDETISGDGHSETETQEYATTEKQPSKLNDDELNVDLNLGVTERQTDEKEIEEEMQTKLPKVDEITERTELEMPTESHKETEMEDFVDRDLQTLSPFDNEVTESTGPNTLNESPQPSSVLTTKDQHLDVQTSTTPQDLSSTKDTSTAAVLRDENDNEITSSTDKNELKITSSSDESVTESKYVSDVTGGQELMTELPRETIDHHPSKDFKLTTVYSENTVIPVETTTTMIISEEKQETPDFGIPEEAKETTKDMTTAVPLFTKEIINEDIPTSKLPEVVSQSEDTSDIPSDEENMTTSSIYNRKEDEKTETNFEESAQTTTSNIHISESITEKIDIQPQDHPTHDSTADGISEKTDVTEKYLITESPYSQTSSNDADKYSTIVPEYEVDQKPKLPVSDINDDNKPISTSIPLLTQDDEIITEKIPTTGLAENESATEKSEYDVIPDKNEQPSEAMSSESNTDHDIFQNSVTEDKQIEVELSTPVSYVSASETKTTEISPYESEMQNTGITSSVSEDQKSSSEVTKQPTEVPFESELTIQEGQHTVAPETSSSKLDTEIEDVRTTESIPIKQEDLPTHQVKPVESSPTVSDESYTTATRLEIDIGNEATTTEVVPSKHEELPIQSEIAPVPTVLPNLDTTEGEEGVSKIEPAILPTESSVFNKPSLITSTEVSKTDTTNLIDVLEEQPLSSKMPESGIETTSRTETEGVTEPEGAEPYTTEKQYVSKSDQEEIPKVPELPEEYITAQTDTETVNKQEDFGTVTTEKQYVTKSDQEDIPKVPELIDGQSTSQGDIESVTKLDDTEHFDTEDQYVTKSDEGVPEIPKLPEEQTIDQTYTEVVKEDSEPFTTERTYVTKLDQDSPKLPEQIEDQSTSRIDTESIIKLEDTEPSVTEKQYVTDSPQDEVPKIPEQIEEQSTSRIDTESINKLEDTEPSVTEKQYVTASPQDEVPKIPEQIEEQSTSRVDTESITKLEDTEPSVTEKQYVTASPEDEVPKIPEQIEEQSTSRVDTESITKLEDIEPSVTERQYLTDAPQDEVPKIPEQIEEQSTSSTDTESITKLEDTEPSVTEKKYLTDSSQDEVPKIPEQIEKQSTSPTDTETITKLQATEPSVTEKQYVTDSTQDEVPKIPEQITEQSTSHTDIESITKLEDTEPSVTEKQYVTASPQDEVPKIPEQIEEQSTSRTDIESITKLEDTEPSVTEKQYLTGSSQDEVSKIPEQIEEQSTSRVDTESITKLENIEPSVTERQYLTDSPQDEVPKIPVLIDEQSTSQSDNEDITKLNDIETYTTEKQFVTKSDEEEVPKIQEPSEEKSTARTDIENESKQDDSGSFTTEKPYVTKSDQEDIPHIPVLVDEQGTSQTDIESVTKLDDTGSFVTEKQYMTNLDQEEVPKIPVISDEESTSPSNKETVTNLNDIEPFTTEKQFVTKSDGQAQELPKEPTKEQSTDKIYTEVVSKSEDSGPFTTERQFVTKFEQEVPKIPDENEDQSTSRYDSESVTKLEDIEPLVTEKQYVSYSDKDETTKYPILSEEQSTPRIATESVTKMEDSGLGHEVPSSHKLDTDVSKPDQDSKNTETITTEPLNYPDTTIKSELEGSDLIKPSEDVAVVLQKDDATELIPTDIFVSTSIPEKIETPTKTVTESLDDFEKYSTERNVQTSVPADDTVILEEVTDAKPYETEHKTPSKSSTDDEGRYSETTPYSVLLEEHTHPVLDETSSSIPMEEGTTLRNEVLPERGDQIPDTPEVNDEYEHTTAKQTEVEKTTVSEKTSSPVVQSGDATETATIVEKMTTDSVTQGEDNKYSPSIQDEGETTPVVLPTIKEKEQHTTLPTMLEKEVTTLGDIIASSEEPETTSTSPKGDITQELSPSSTSKLQEESTTHLPTSEDKYKEKPLISSPLPSSSELPEILEEPHEEEHLPDFPPSGTGAGYGQEPDYVEEDQAFGPGTCRYGGKVYVSAQQIPRDDPCDFCFCFRSDIICLQQSCPPPIHGCHEEPIQGFCCPRYECPVSMATTVNVTTTTTTTTTTLPPHFLPHAYKGAAQRRGCQIKGHSYKVGEVVRASSGPCLHCTCGGDGQMKCDPKACTPEPMLRQMIAAAVSAKRRR